MKQTQLEFIKQRLNENGKISRNECLQNYISRLGARIADLRKEGWNIEGEFEKTDYGKDYVYRKVEEAKQLSFYN